MGDKSVFNVVDTATRMIYICPLSYGSLVVITSKSRSPESILPHINTAVYKLEKCLF